MKKLRKNYILKTHNQKQHGDAISSKVVKYMTRIHRNSLSKMSDVITAT